VACTDEAVRGVTVEGREDLKGVVVGVWNCNEVKRMRYQVNVQQSEEDADLEGLLCGGADSAH
jgi:hypothetical protein